MSKKSFTFFAFKAGIIKNSGTAVEEGLVNHKPFQRRRKRRPTPNRLEISGWRFFLFPKKTRSVRTLIFTENWYDRSMEKMMKGIPNFHPRGSRIVVAGNFRYTAEMCDCEYCGYYDGKKKGCLVPKCVCLEERISVGVASVKEILNETMSEIKHGGFIRRLKRYIVTIQHPIPKT